MLVVLGTVAFDFSASLSHTSENVAMIVTDIFLNKAVVVY